MRNGRSGKLFAFQYADIIPDVVLISKAIGGSQPMAVVVYNKELDVWTPGAHAGTFRGNQLAMKAGTIVLNRVSKPEFLADVVRKGDLIREKLNDLKKRVSIIGDIRGIGLSWSVQNLLIQKLRKTASVHCLQAEKLPERFRRFALATASS